ncbi:MAG: hydantoinase/oxoprolinase N-terminal domain-containing protein, partial [Pseudolysinimonas sp.]
MGIDIGGTKTDAVAIDVDGRVAHQLRLPTGFGDEAVLATAVAAVEGLAHAAGH